MLMMTTNLNQTTMSMRSANANNPHLGLINPPANKSSSSRSAKHRNTEERDIQQNAPNMRHCRKGGQRGKKDQQIGVINPVWGLLTRFLLRKPPGLIDPCLPCVGGGYQPGAGVIGFPSDLSCSCFMSLLLSFSVSFA